MGNDMTMRPDITTTVKDNPNLLFITADRISNEFKEPRHLPYSLLDRLREAALQCTAGLPCSDPRTFIRFVWEDISLSEDCPEINIEVSVRNDKPMGKFWRYVGDISYARNFHAHDDNIFETHEIVESPTKADPHHTDLRIFGEFKSIKCALKDLLGKGNFTHDGRRGRRR